MAKRLYVGNLPYDTTDDQLRDLFAGAGSVTSAQVIHDRISGRSKGFGFVEMSSDEEANGAIDMFNGKAFPDANGRNLVVNEARPMEPRQPRQGGGMGGGMGGGRGGRGGFSRGGDNY